MTKVAELTDRALISIGGADAEDFLQNLITCNVTGMDEGAATFGALLTPQGKILFEFFVLRLGSTYVFDCAASFQADLIKRLTFYKLRAAVDISGLDGQVFASWNGDDLLGFADPRLPALGHRVIVTDGANMATTANLDDYKSHRILLGVAELGEDFGASEVFPHEAMMDQWADAGIDFKKGCYVGQEVVSRMQHRGTARSRFVGVASGDGSPLPELGTPITADGKTLGKLGGSTVGNGLALLRLDRLEKAVAAGGKILADQSEISVIVPAFFQPTAA